MALRPTPLNYVADGHNRGDDYEERAAKREASEHGPGEKVAEPPTETGATAADQIRGPLEVSGPVL
jgi:hypothetical protein